MDAEDSILDYNSDGEIDENENINENNTGNENINENNTENDNFNENNTEDTNDESLQDDSEYESSDEPDDSDNFLHEKIQQWLDSEDRDRVEFTLLPASAFMQSTGYTNEQRENQREKITDKIRDYLKDKKYKFKPFGDSTFRVDFNHNLLH